MGLTGTFPKSKSEKIIKTPVEEVVEIEIITTKHNYNPRYYMEKIMDIGHI